MPEFTVTSVEKVKEIPDAKYGPAKVLKLGLENGDGTLEAEWFTKEATPDPEVGSKIEGEIEHDPKWGAKFKKPGPGGGGGGGGFKKSPAQEQRIVRQHSQGMACQVIAVLGQVPSEQEFVNLVNWFEADAFGKLKSGTAGWPTTSDVPIDTAGL